MRINPNQTPGPVVQERENSHYLRKAAGQSLSSGKSQVSIKARMPREHLEKRYLYNSSKENYTLAHLVQYSKVKIIFPQTLKKLFQHPMLIGEESDASLILFLLWTNERGFCYFLNINKSKVLIKSKIMEFYLDVSQV